MRSGENHSRKQIEGEAEEIFLRFLACREKEHLMESQHSHAVPLPACGHTAVSEATSSPPVEGSRHFKLKCVKVVTNLQQS
jgi:hypothetical protein